MLMLRLAGGARRAWEGVLDRRGLSGYWSERDSVPWLWDLRFLTIIHSPKGLVVLVWSWVGSGVGMGWERDEGLGFWGGGGRMTDGQLETLWLTQLYSKQMAETPSYWTDWSKDPIRILDVKGESKSIWIHKQVYLPLTLLMVWVSIFNRVAN